MKLSIITVNLNNGEGLQKTIESVVNQTFQDYEYIVIDGASTDKSVDVIKQYADKITYWVSEPDKGIYNAMNKGILHAKGEYCLFLNSGDALLPEILCEVFKDTFSEDVVFGEIACVNETATVEITNTRLPLTMFQFYRNSIPHPASFIKRSLLGEDMYDENYQIISDWDFFVKKIIIEDCSYRYLAYPISVFQKGGVSETNRSVHHKEAVDGRKKYLPPRMIADYEKLVLYDNLKMEFLVEHYSSRTGIKRLIPYLLVKSIIAYHLFCKWCNIKR